MWVGGSVSAGGGVFAVNGGHASVCVLSCWGGRRRSLQEKFKEVTATLLE